MSKYKSVRFPKDAYEKLVLKKKHMEEDYKELTGKVKKIPMTNVIRFLSRDKIYLDENEIVRLAKRRWKI